MALQSALTGFHLDWVEGVKVADIPDKALPFVRLFTRKPVSTISLIRRREWTGKSGKGTILVHGEVT